MTWDLQLVAPWFAAAASFVLLVAHLLGKTPRRAKARLAGLYQDAQGVPPTARNARSGNPRCAAAIERKIENRVRKQDQSHDLRDRIVQAGIYRKHAVTIFVVLRMVLFASMLGLGLLAVYFRLLAPLPAMIIGVLAGLGATLAPTFWLDHVRRTRQNQIRRALPDALDLMGVCLQGGLSLTGSLSRVSQELGTAHPMLALELAIVEREMQMGLSAGEALRQFARRFDLEELRSLASVIGQTEKFGSSVTKALRTYADSLRVKRQQQAEEMAQKAAVKILFPTLLCIFPGIFIVVLGPAAIRIYEMLLVGAPWGG